MSWGRLDDKMAFHAKVVKAGNEAVGAWARMISLSCAQGTNGKLSTEQARLIARPSVLAKLVDVVLLEQVEGGFAIHDFTEWNPTAEEVKAKRDDLSEKRAEAGRAGAAKRWQRATELDGIADSDAMANGWQLLDGKNGKPIAPSPPIPTKSDPPLPPKGASESGMAKPTMAKSEATDADPWGLSPDGKPDAPSSPPATEPEPEAVTDRATPRELEYQRAYERGIAAGKGSPYAMPYGLASRGALAQAVQAHCRDENGKAYRGDMVLDWITGGAAWPPPPRSRT